MEGKFRHSNLQTFASQVINNWKEQKKSMNFSSSLGKSGGYGSRDVTPTSTKLQQATIWLSTAQLALD